MDRDRVGRASLTGAGRTRSALLFASLPGHNDHDHSDPLGVHRLNCSVGARRTPLLREVWLRADPGEVVALVGASGAGKTILAPARCGLAEESSGSVRLGGRSIRPTQRSRFCWFVMQDADHRLSAAAVHTELALGRKVTAALVARAESVPTDLELWECRLRHPASLSGGQKQRPTLAIALMQDSPLLPLDEPTSGLDGRDLELLTSRLRRKAEAGKAALVTRSPTITSL